MSRAGGVEYNSRMRSSLVLCTLLAACGSNPEAGNPASPAPSAAASDPAVASDPAATPQAAAEDVEDVAMRLYRAIYAGDADTVRSLALPLDELNGFTTKEIDREAYEAAMADYLTEAAADRPAVEVVRVEVIESGVLRADDSEKITRDLTYAFVRPFLRVEGETGPGMPTFFIKGAAGWRFSPKK